MSGVTQLPYADAGDHARGDRRAIGSRRIRARGTVNPHLDNPAAGHHPLRAPEENP
jgi:hypothetical protein